MSSKSSAEASKTVISKEEEKDPVEEMLDRTGCKKIHYDLQVIFLLSFLRYFESINHDFCLGLHE